MSKVSPLVLFVNPSLGTERYEADDKLRSYLSLGALASALRDVAFLKRFGKRLGKKEINLDVNNQDQLFDIRVLNLSLKPESLTVKKFLARFLSRLVTPPLMVCMTATSAQLDEAMAVARAAEEIAPNAIRIIGGAHVSVAALDFLKRSEFQLACIGEGVETLAELALQRMSPHGPDYSTIAGIAFKDGKDHVHLNSLRTPIMSLDEYPFPSNSIELFWEHAEDPAENRRHLIYILSGFGCPYDCIFCAQRSIHHKRIRERSAENIYQEIEHLYTLGFRKFAFVQETFLNHEKRIDAICRLIEDAGTQVEWTAEARADQLTYTRLKRMRSAGLRFIQIGVETGDQVLLKKLGKHIDLDQIIDLRGWCRNLRIDTAFYLLVGLPGQDWQSILRSALFVKDHPPFNRITKHASVSIAIPYPGTKIGREHTVRLLYENKKQFSWPQRNPEVSVNEAGEFAGRNFTETDDMTSDEIFEAWLYLDDYCHFLLHALDREYNDSIKKAKSLEYADRMIYMIVRRTIRDLIIRAHSPFTAEKRRAAYSEILELDWNIERHFKDVTTATEPLFDSFARFLAAVNFLNGFDTMICLGVGSRIKWMKICALIWSLKKREINDYHFNLDDRQTGIELDRRLLSLDEGQLNRCLGQMDDGESSPSAPEISISGDCISAFGVSFREAGDRRLEISL